MVPMGLFIADISSASFSSASDTEVERADRDLVKNGGLTEEGKGKGERGV